MSDIEKQMIGDYIPEDEMLRRLLRYYSTMNPREEPDYLFYLLIKDYVEDARLLFIRNTYKIYSVKEFARKLLEVR